MKKKLCLLTGASRGIGAGILSALAQLDEPVEVIAIAKRAESVATIRQQMRAQSLEGHAFSVDVTSEQSVSELFKTIATKYERGIDWLINNAGVTHDNLLLRMKESDWDSVIETNMTAVFQSMEAIRVAQASFKPSIRGHRTTPGLLPTAVAVPMEPPLVGMQLPAVTTPMSRTIRPLPRVGSAWRKRPSPYRAALRAHGLVEPVRVPETSMGMDGPMS